MSLEIDLINLAINPSAASAIGRQTAKSQTQNSVATALTATGTNQATGLALTNIFNAFGTVALSTACSLPLGVDIGGEINIFNGGANALLVCTGVGDTSTLNATAGATGVSLAAGARVRWVRTSATAWNSF
jgi:hypothetical protein